MHSQKKARFYVKGLQFECTKCGKCCTGFPGFVYLSESDILSITKYLKENIGRFLIKYTKNVSLFHENRYSLIEKPNYDCVFWDSLCTIYPARPYQCRTYPFWKKHVVSEREWEKAGKFCPGINRGIVHSKDLIENFVQNIPGYAIRKFSSDFKKD
ncbi:MAG TPA: YkgJ family cysteine cluster protein [Spirochaetes bacterium]|nr:YkgJ family cysteine cluster protein [Spirochaetota bacterium]